MPQMRRVCWLFSTLLFASMGLWAQTNRGTITGTVTDPSGAVIGGVSVTATNKGTGISSTASTGANGSYTIPLLPVGVYDLTAEQSGFKKFVQNGISVQVGQTARVDVAMQVGEVSQTVEVQAEAPQLRPDTSDLGTVLSGAQILDLPLTGQGEQRNPAFFMILVPGVTGRGTSYGGGPTFDNRNLGTTVNGSQSASNEFHLEGALIATPAEWAGDFRALGFPQDAVQEFKLTTGNAQAEYGRSGGGITSFTLRSGTNNIHGSVYEFLRNEVFDANQFFNNQRPPDPETGKAPRTANKQNEFGFTIGAPIKKDRTFAFGWFQGFRLRRGAVGELADVPTVAFKNGDFSNYRDASGNLIPIYDPATERIVNGQKVRDQFPGNIVPKNRFDPVSAAMLPYWPDPTIPGKNAQNFFGQRTAGADGEQWGIKIDHAIGDKDKIYGSFLSSHLFTPGSGAIPGAFGSGGDATYNLRNFRLSEDHFFAPNVINHVVLGYNRVYSKGGPPDCNPGYPAKIGLKNVAQDSFMPVMNIDGFNQFATFGCGIDAANAYNVSQSLTWIKGRHNWKFGFEYLKMQQNDRSTGRDSGFFTTARQGTALPGTTELTGAGFASFLLGQISSGEVRRYLGTNQERSGYYGGYVQDDFKVSPKLTLNLGLRWDGYRPTVDAHDQLAWMDPLLPNPAAGGRPGAMAFAIDGDRRTGAVMDKKAFGPRVGLAYSLGSKTVLRTNYGIFYSAGGYIRASRGLFIQGWNTNDSVTSPDAGFTPSFFLKDGFPTAPCATCPPFVRPPFISPAYNLNGAVEEMAARDAHVPYLQNFSFNIQQDLGHNMLLDLAWVGNKGTRLQSRLYGGNMMDPRHLSLGSLLFEDISSPAAIAAGIRPPYPGFSGTVGQSLRTFPQYASVRRMYEGEGMSTYHALQAKFEKRFAQGLQFLAAYTWSKTLTDAESQFSEFSGFTQSFFDRKAEKALSLNDFPHNLVVNYSYELPFGPGKKFVNQGGAAGKILGGWRLAGIQQYQSGPPQIIFAPNNLFPLVGAPFVGRPNVVPGADPRSAAAKSGDFDPARDVLFNPAAFNLPASQYALGNGPRTYGNARRFPYYNEDFSVIKYTQVNERVNIEFRAEFLNAFNRVLFGVGTQGDQYGSAIGAGNFLDPAFGKIASQSNYARQIQFGLKVHY
jgi:hypothetical protein